MALNTSIESPNLKVYQVQKSSSTTFTTPSLGALVIGPCKEIVNAFDDKGNLNSGAKFSSTYSQLPLLITQSAFPYLRGMELLKVRGKLKRNTQHLLMMKREPTQMF